MGSKTSVPVTELQDFESQISCTTIEKNFDGKNNESEMAMSDDDCEIAMEEETSHETPGVNSYVAVTTSLSHSGPLVERKHLQSSDTVLIEGKTMEVTNIIKKLVSDKNITISRKEEENNLNVLKKNSEVRRFKAKDCDKNDEVKKVSTPCLAQKSNLASHKRAYQALKSVRIPKKTERKLELPGKRQKVDET